MFVLKLAVLFKLRSFEPGASDKVINVNLIYRNRARLTRTDNKRRMDILA